MKRKGFTPALLTTLCVLIACVSVGFGRVPNQISGGKNLTTNTAEFGGSLDPVLSFHFLSLMKPLENQSEKKDLKRTGNPQSCLLQNGSMIEHGKSFREVCATFTCNDGAITSPQAPTFRADCPEDFDEVSRLGCVKLFTEGEQTWCKAREKCFNVGADLVTFDSGSNRRNMEALVRYVRKLKDFKGETWVGFRRISPSGWKWTIGDLPVRDNSRLFAKREPNGRGSSACARLKGDRFSDWGCETNTRSSDGFAYLCEIPGFG